MHLASNLAALAAVDWGEDLVQPLLVTLVIGSVAIFLLVITLWVLDKVSPFSLHKEIETDQNVALAIVMASVVIGVALVIAAVARG